MPVYKVQGKNIEDYGMIKRWMFGLKSNQAMPERFDSSTTKRNALYYFSLFCNEVVKLNPDEIIQLRREDRKSDDEIVNHRFEEFAEKFNLYIREQGGTANSATTALGHIRSFFKHNYQKLEILRVPKGKPTRLSKIPTVPELARMCAYRKITLRMKAWILCQAESGISNIDLLSLSLDTFSPEFGTIQQQLEANKIPIHLRVTREKTMAKGLGPYDTFLGKNAVAALKAYISDDTSGISLGDRLFEISDRRVQILVKKIARKTKVGTETAPVRPYCLRKFFNTFMKLAGVNESIVEYWMGHSQGKVKGAYFVPPVQKQIEVYEGAYPQIDITIV